jgi:hypothetical protein
MAMMIFSGSRKKFARGVFAKIMEHVAGIGIMLDGRFCSLDIFCTEENTTRENRNENDARRS